MKREAISALELTGNERVLEIGVGSGLGIRRLLRRLPWGYVSGVDRSETRVRRAKRRNRRQMRVGLIDLRCGSTHDLPWANGLFDACIWTSSLGLCDARGLREVRRVLKPDGRVVIAVPAGSSEGLTSALWTGGFVCVRETDAKFVTARAA